MDRTLRPSRGLWQRLRPAPRRMRKEATPAEQVLWAELRNRRFAGRKFRRQHPMGRFVADFCCPEAGLVVELDGPIHKSQREQDAQRDQWMAERGFRVLRFRNEDVMERLDVVLNSIAASMTDQP